MSMAYDQERREFTRIKAEIPVRYKFLCKHLQDSRLDQNYEGITKNIGAGGLLLRGTIPDINWLPDLLMQKIIIGIKLYLPNQGSPIKALTRVAWVETVDEKTHHCNIGLKFREITSEDKDKIFQFIIRIQLPS